MYGKMKEHLCNTIAEIREAGLYKEERLIESPQKAAIQVKGKEVLNFCANNYLGLSDHPRLIEGAKKMMDKRGFGMPSVPLICGSQHIHIELEAAISDYFNTSKQKTPSSMQPASMPTVAFSNHCLLRKMPSSAMLLTTLPSSTVFVCARPSATATPMLTWQS